MNLNIEASMFKSYGLGRACKFQTIFIGLFHYIQIFLQHNFVCFNHCLISHASESFNWTFIALQNNGRILTVNQTGGVKQRGVISHSGCFVAFYSHYLGWVVAVFAVVSSKNDWIFRINDDWIFLNRLEEEIFIWKHSSLFRGWLNWMLVWGFSVGWFKLKRFMP